MSEDFARQFQDLGELKSIVREPEDIGASGVEPLLPDDAARHGEALSDIRAVVDEYYGDHLDHISGEGERVVIERLVVPSNDLPHIEYQLVEEYDDG